MSVYRPRFLLVFVLGLLGGIGLTALATAQRTDKRLRGLVVTTSASLLKHKGHEGPQSIAFESWTSVPECHATCGPTVVASTDCLKRKERYDRYGHRKETL